MWCALCVLFIVHLRVTGVFKRIFASTNSANKDELLGNQIKNKLDNVKTFLQAYADNEAPGQSAHSCSLIRAFAVYKQIHWIL